MNWEQGCLNGNKAVCNQDQQDQPDNRTLQHPVRKQERVCKHREESNLIFYGLILSTPLVFVFIEFHLCKSATEEQTNSPELSVLSEVQIVYHFLHCAQLITSGVACNGCPQYTTLISTAQRCVSLNNNEKIKFNLFAELFVGTWFRVNIYVSLDVCIELMKRSHLKNK